MVYRSALKRILLRSQSTSRFTGASKGLPGASGSSSTGGLCINPGTSGSGVRKVAATSEDTGILGEARWRRRELEESFTFRQPANARGLSICSAKVSITPSRDGKREEEEEEEARHGSALLPEYAKSARARIRSTALSDKCEAAGHCYVERQQQPSIFIGQAELSEASSSRRFSDHTAGRAYSQRGAIGIFGGVRSGSSCRFFSSVPAAAEGTHIAVDGGDKLESLQASLTGVGDAASSSVSGLPPSGGALSEVAVAAADSSVPTAFVQYVIDGVHLSTGLPWWASIAATTFAIRTLVFPLVVYQMKATARLTLLRPDLEKLTNRIKESGYDPKVVEDNQARMKALFVRHKTSPFSPMLGAFIQAPVFMCFFFGIRNMAEKMESFKEGGALWFTDLSTPDSLFIMPVLSGAFFLLTVELGAADGMQGQPILAKMKMFMRGLSVLLVPLTASFPKALFCYWLTANVCSIIQAQVLKQPGVKAALGIPDVSHLAKPADVPVGPMVTFSQPPKLKGEKKFKR